MHGSSSGHRIGLAVLITAAGVAGGLFVNGRAATADTYLPSEGGAAYYKQWTNGRLGQADFFPISVWLQDPDRAAAYKAIGVNQFVGLWKGPTDVQLARLTAAGMSVFCDQKPGAIRGPSSGIIQGWVMSDEPDNAQEKFGGGWGSCILPPVVATEYRRLKQADPGRPVLLNLGQAIANETWPGRGEFCSRHDEHYPEYIRATDIVSYDVYPVNEKVPLWYVGKGVDRLRKWAEYKKPVWNWIETTSISGGPKPLPSQVKSEVWISIIHGSMGIGYFCHSFKPKESEAELLEDAEMRQGVAAVNGQVASLAAVLNAPSVANGVTVASSNGKSPIDVMLKRQNGATYLFAVGGRPGGATTATFQLRDAPAKLTAEVVGESRTVTVAGGKFEDRFGDYQVHIYRLPWAP